MTARRIGIVGSRRRTDADTVRKVVASLPAGSIVVSGGATGPDTWAEEAAASRGFRTLIFRPDLKDTRHYWDACRRYHARNQLIVDACDELVAFPAPDRKGGTEDTIRRARRKGIPVIIL